MSKLNVTELERRDTPSTVWTGRGYVGLEHPIPGWTGEVHSTFARVQGHWADIFVAGEGGAGRVRARSADDGSILFDTVVLDPNMRIGADVAAVGTLLAVFPLEGGAAHVAIIDLENTTAPPVNVDLGYGREYRGGLTGASADTDGDGRQEFIAIPIDGPPRVAAYDPYTGRTTRSFFAGSPTDTRQRFFVPAAVGVQLTGPGTDGLVLDVGAPNSGETVMFGWDGTEYSDRFAGDTMWLADASRNTYDYSDYEAVFGIGAIPPPVPPR